MLAEVLARLPDDYREVLILRNLEGLSHEEVAQRDGSQPRGGADALGPGLGGRPQGGEQD